MRIALAFRAFWVALFSKEMGNKIDSVLRGQILIAPPSELNEKETPIAGKNSKDRESADRARTERTHAKPAAPARSEALTLLSSLQREARFIDLVQESLDGYSDAQIGAAARDVLRDSKKVLDRLFAIGPVCEKSEGEQMHVPEGASALRFRIVGRGSNPQKGTLVHRGWQANSVALPQWTGTDTDANVLAPAEIEVT